MGSISLIDDVASVTDDILANSGDLAKAGALGGVSLGAYDIGSDLASAEEAEAQAELESQQSQQNILQNEDIPVKERLALYEQSQQQQSQPKDDSGGSPLGDTDPVTLIVGILVLAFVLKYTLSAE